MTSYVLRCSDPTCALETQNRGISYSCASCGGLLEVAYDFEGAAPGDWPRLWRSRLGSWSEPDRSGVWRFRELLPFLGREQTHVISLGEGGTPLVLAARSASWAGIDQLWVKHQGANPTGSFKDLGMTACISHGVSVGATCAAGRFAVLLGASGSGKTTLLRCIAGIEKITAGTIDIGGMAVADRHIHLAPERRELAMVFQDYALWPHMTVEQNVAFALHRHRLAPETARRQTRAMLERVGLDALGHRYPNELSGGEQQRVALARALVANTGLILFDEPLSNLDAHLRDRLRVEIATLVRECGATAIYITHDQAEAFCARR
jgi:ABC-type nitrate/sulfonate/bicarbonate transport system ATPase subunit